MRNRARLRTACVRNAAAETETIALRERCSQLVLGTTTPSGTTTIVDLGVLNRTTRMGDTASVEDIGTVDVAGTEEMTGGSEAGRAGAREIC